MSPLIILGGIGLLAFVLSRGAAAAEPAPFVEAVILGGTAGDDYDMVESALQAKVSPFDKDAVIVFYNDSEGAVDPKLREAINMNAKEAGIKTVAHVFGPSPDAPFLVHYREGVVVEEPELSTWDEVINWLEGKSRASVGGMETVAVASAGQMVPVAVAMAGKMETVAVASAGSKHMGGMFASRATPRVSAPGGKGRVRKARKPPAVNLGKRIKRTR